MIGPYASAGLFFILLGISYTVKRKSEGLYKISSN